MNPGLWTGKQFLFVYLFIYLNWVVTITLFLANLELVVWPSPFPLPSCILTLLFAAQPWRSRCQESSSLDVKGVPFQYM